MIIGAVDWPPSLRTTGDHDQDRVWGTRSWLQHTGGSLLGSEALRSASSFNRFGGWRLGMLWGAAEATSHTSLTQHIQHARVDGERA